MYIKATTNHSVLNNKGLEKSKHTKQETIEVTTPTSTHRKGLMSNSSFKCSGDMVLREYIQNLAIKSLFWEVKSACPWFSYLPSLDRP